MADDSWLLREDGYLNIDTSTSSIIYHPNLNVILLSTESGEVHVLDVNSGVILQSSSLSGEGNGPIGIQYLPGSDRIVFWDGNGLGVRSDYNGVLLLHTVLQQTLKPSNPDQIVKIELFLSEAVLLYQCLQSIELISVECSGEVVKALGEAIEQANDQPKKGIKAQKWSTICLELPHLSLKLVASNMVSELKRHNRHVPALAIASALNQRISDLMPGSAGNSKQDANDRGLMFSEAARRETFKRWPHMDYKWALPSQMAQAGFYHQPSSSGDDRAMCFTCFVCLVCWERTDEPWSEHERHSPNCPLVKGEYTHNVPLSVTYATSPAISHPGISIVSRGNSGDVFLTGTRDGKVSIWNIDCKLKLQQDFTMSFDESLLQNKLYGPYSSVRNAWDEDLEKENGLELHLSSLAIVGRCQNKDQPCSKSSLTASQQSVSEGQCRVRPTIVCGINISCAESPGKTPSSIWGDTEDSASVITTKAVVHSSEAVKAMNDHNQAKSNSSVRNSSYLLVYDFQGKCAQTVSPLTNGNGCVSLKNTSGKSGGSKKCAGVANPNCRSGDPNIYDDIYLSKYMCLEDEPELSPEVAFVTGLNEQVTVIDFKSLVGTSSKDLVSQVNDMNPKNSLKSMNGNNSLPKSIEFISTVSIPSNMQHPIAIHPASDIEPGFDSYTLESNKKMSIPKYSCPYEAASEIDFKKMTDELDAANDKENETLNYHNHLPFLGISDILYEYKDSGIKMKVPYSKPSTTKSTNAKSTSNESPESEILALEDSPPPACVAVQCISFPSPLSVRPDLTITHVVPTNDGDHLLVVLSSKSGSGCTDKNSFLVNGFDDRMDIEEIDLESDPLTMKIGDEVICDVNTPTSYLVLYSLKFDSIVTLINEIPLCIKEIPYGETPLEVCLLPNLEGNIPGIGLAATIGQDGALRLLELSSLESIAEAKVESSKFISVAFCSSLEKLCACTEKGAMYFYAVRDSEGDSTEEFDEEDAQSENWLNQQAAQGATQDQAQPPMNQPNLIAQKSLIDREVLDDLVQLAGVGKGDNIVAYSAVVPSCWCELLPAQRPRSENQNLSRTWRLQNTASTWDEHVLELTLPWSLSIAHVELRFTLHSPCPTPPNIQVTLLKQHLHGIGHRKESSKCFSRIDDQINFNLIDSEHKGPVENPVRSTEYLRAHNAEILAGPLSLAQGLDLTQQSGTLTLTSPRLFKARGRTLLLHIKTLFDPSKEMHQGKISSSKKSKTSENSDQLFTLPGSTVERFAMPTNNKKVEFYIGCDWLHEISITVRSNKHTDIPLERVQRIAMLESNGFLENLLGTASNNSDKYAQSMALDLLIWIVSIRLARFRTAKPEAPTDGEFENMNDDSSTSDRTKNQFSSRTESENQQFECVKIVQQNVSGLVKNCILLSKRSIAKKCIKLILICSEGAKNLDEETSSQFELAILESVTLCLPLVGAVRSAGSLRWFTQLAMRAAPLDTDMRFANICIQLLRDIASIMRDLANPYHLILRSRFGLYGLPMESTIFDVEPPVLGKSSSIPLTYASIVAGDTGGASSNNSHQEIDLRDLYNYTGKSSAGWWWHERGGGSGGIAGLGEVMALRVSCHSASDGTQLESAPHQGVSTPAVDHSQFWDLMGPKEFTDYLRASAETDAMKNVASEMNQNDSSECPLMECESAWPQSDRAERPEDAGGSPFHYKDGSKCNNGNGSIPWQQLVQQPPQQVLVIKRMHSGARHFVVLDFGHPVKLTDLIIPACPELVTLSIHIWLVSEDQDSTRLVMAPDISAKNLIMSDIQPPPLCRYLKITTIGRYNMSTTRCKIPLGWFYGEVADSVSSCEQPHVNTLTALHQDLTCRFRLAVGKLTDSLDPYLDMSGGNAAHMTAYLDQQNDTDPRVRSAYQECLELQQQMNTVERITEKFRTSSRSNSDDAENTIFEDLQKHPPAALLRQASIDKLRTIAEEITDILLYICFECDNNLAKRPLVSVSMSACALMVRWLVVVGGNAGPRLQAALASVLARLCCTQSWWGSFLADTTAHLYSPDNTLIFPQDRVLILLVYMGRKSLWRGGVVECVSRLVSRLLPPPLPPTSPGSPPPPPVWQQADLSLLAWLLIYLAALLDTAQPKDASSNAWSRWDFLSGCNGSGASATAGAGGAAGAGRAGGPAARLHRRKLHKRLFHHRLEELEAVRKAFQVQALSALSSQAASLTLQHAASDLTHAIKTQENIFKTTLKQHWVKRFEDFIQNRISVLNKRVSSGGSGGSSRGGGAGGSGAGVGRDEPTQGAEPRLPPILPQALALQLSRGLISLILSMDFTCNTDLLLLACKVVGRLSGVCGGLPNVIREHEVVGLLRAACSPAPWHQHTILTLLQDLVEYDRTGWRGPVLPPSILPLIQTEAPDGTIQWHTAQNIPISFAHDLGSEPVDSEMIASPTNKEDSAASGSAELLPSLIESDDSDMEEFLDEISERRSSSLKKNIPKPPMSTNNGTSIAVDARLELGIELSGEVLVRKLAILGGGSLAAAVHTPAPPPSTQAANQSSPAGAPTPDTSTETPPAKDLTAMLKQSFHLLFTELDQQDDSSYLERVLQLWITLNGCSWGVSNTTPPADCVLTPKIKLSTQSVVSLIHALNQQTNISLRCWVLAFQCLSWVANSPMENAIPDVMAGVVIEGTQFSEMLVKFLSSNLSSDMSSAGGEKSCVGPVACAMLSCLLGRIVSRAPVVGRTALIGCVRALAGANGALRTSTGPVDAQRELLRVAHSHVYSYSNEHLEDALSIVESIGVIAQSTCSTSGVDSYGIGESVSGTGSSSDSSGGAGLGGMLAEALSGSDNARPARPPDRRELVVALIGFARALLAMPLQSEEHLPDPMEQMPEQTTDESQTDESKASQQTTSDGANISTSTSNAIPCLADRVLQLYPTMKRIFKTLSTCSAPNIALLTNYAINADHVDNLSVGDALFKFVSALADSTTHPRLMLIPLLDFIGNERGGLSEALVSLLLRYLENSSALQCWVGLGGCEALCARLVGAQRSAPGPRAGLVAALHTHLRRPLQPPTLADKQPAADLPEGLINYAPLSTISSSNPSTQSAEALLGGGAGGTAVGPGPPGGGGGGGAHRRTRSAAWSHHFCRAEGSVDLVVRLPHAVLLHEVQLQPHLTTLSTCPSAVSLEVCAQGCVMTPLGPPQPTAGMTYIRLKLVQPLVVNTVLIRLYRPRDSSNMGLLNIRILGTAAFASPTSPERFDEKMAGTSVGWARVLVSCVLGSVEARSRAARSPGLAEAAAGLLLGGAAPPSVTGPLLRALGAEPPAALHVLDLVLRNAHIPAHHGYQYSSQLSVNTNSAVDAACDLLYQLCTLQNELSSQRIKRYIDWLKDCGESAISHAEQRSSDTNFMTANFTYNTKYLSSVYIQCLSSVLWSAKEQQVQYELEPLITIQLFDTVYKWIGILPKDAAIKKALDAVMCSICYIRPELFTMMLEKMGVLTLDTRSSSFSSVNVEASISDDRKDLEAMTSMTDDTKVCRVPSHQSLKPTSLEELVLTPAQLMTIAAACMSPDAIKTLMKSDLPLNVAEAIKQFCLQQCQADRGSSSSDSSLTDSDKANTRESFSRHYQHPEIGGLVSLEMLPILVEWLSCLCMDAELKNWLGGPQGSCFWSPLLLMLCLPQSNSRIWPRNEFYTQLEEKTIRFFGSVMTCHLPNQQLFATTLYHVISSHPDTSPGIGAPIGGFTRGLLLRLVLRGERVSVGVRGAAGKPAPLAKCPLAPAPPALSAHPALRGRMLLALPHHTRLADLVTQHLSFGGSVWSSGDTVTGKKASSVVRGASADSAGQEADPWGLTVAAANTAKDKRSKDVRNLCAKQAMLSKKKGKKEDQPSGSTSNANSSQDSWTLHGVKVYVDGLEGPVSLNTTLGTLCAVTEHKFGPSLNLTAIPQSSNDGWSENSMEGVTCRPPLLGVFAGAGGLALLARHLPPVCPTPPAPAPPPPPSTSNNADTDWVKLDEIYEDVGEASGNTATDEASNSVPTHSLVALGLLLRLPGYAEALLKEGHRAVHLLRLLLGVTDDGEGKDIMCVCGPGLGTLAFRVLVSLLDGSPLHTDDGQLLRGTLLRSGSMRLLLACLAVFTHQQPDSPPQEANNANGSSSKAKAEEKSKLYWAKGTGFGTGSTQQSWNVEQSLMRQKTEEEHVTVLLQVIASYIQPGEQWGRRQSDGSEASSSDTGVGPSTSSAQQQQAPALPAEFTQMLQRSALLPAISSYLRNDSVLDMSRHIPLYLAVMRVVRAVMSSGVLWGPGPPLPALQAIPPLLHQMSRTVDTYATKLKMNKKTIYGKSSYSHRFGTTTTDGGEDDEGLAMLIPDIQATSALVQARLGLSEEGTALLPPMPRAPSAATREARYLEVMRRLQFETFEMISECPDNGYKFTVAYHFEGTVRAAGERSHPARMKRLAQEAVTLSTSLPLSYSSSVFVRTDQDRLDVMKVLITGPSDTPYANGCFELDVYFPVDYPNTPMLINLETTGRHSVRFNPNLYLDGKVCLSVLNTWHGRPEEQWNAQTSSFLQVLVSIQSLILVPEPYFNEPGFERSRGTPGGTHHSLEYNSNIYQACVRWAMLEQLRNPTSCFQQVIQTHFWLKRDEICSVIEGWIAELEMQSGDKRTQRNICLNAIALKRHYSNLREELAKLPVPPGLEELETPFSAAPSPTAPPSQPPQDMDQDMEKLVSQVCE